MRVHPDAGTLPSHHSHRGPVHGGRQALAQIDAELSQPAAPELDRVCTLETVGWLHGEIDRNEAKANDLDTRAIECMELAKRLRHRNGDLRALLTVANPTEHVPGTHTATAVQEQQPAPRPLPGSVDLLTMSRSVEDPIEPCQVRFFSYPVAIVARFFDAQGRETGASDHPVSWSASDLVKYYRVRGWIVATAHPAAAEPPRAAAPVPRAARQPDDTTIDSAAGPRSTQPSATPQKTWWSRPPQPILANGDIDQTVLDMTFGGLPVLDGVAE